MAILGVYRSQGFNGIQICYVAVMPDGTVVINPVTDPTQKPTFSIIINGNGLVKGDLKLEGDLVVEGTIRARGFETLP